MEKSPSGRRDSSSSPEFEFWAVRNPSCPQPHLLTADQLFDNGVLLPLHHLPYPKPDPNPEPEPEPDPDPDPELEPPPPPSSSASKRWKDIFRKVEKKPSSAEDDADEDSKKKEKEKKKLIKKDWKSSNAPAATAAAAATDLNINIWPFSRSRSAGTGGRGKAVPPAAARKVSSAPCSRSNSRGESSKARKWPSSPGRPGLHLGRSSPVWQVRRGGKASSEAVPGGAPKEGNGSGSRRSTNSNGGHARVLNLNVPLCMGYRHHLSCRSDDNNRSLGGSAQSSSSNSNNSNSNSNSNGNATLFNLRTLFSKKVY